MSPTAASRLGLNPLAPSWTPARPLDEALPATIFQTANFGAIGEPVPTTRLTLTVPFEYQLALVDFVRLQLSHQDPTITPPGLAPYTPFRGIDPPGTSAFEPELGVNIFENRNWDIRNASARGRLTSGILDSRERPESHRAAEPGRLFESRDWHTTNTSAAIPTNDILERTEAPARRRLPETNRSAARALEASNLLASKVKRPRPLLQTREILWSSRLNGLLALIVANTNSKMDGFAQTRDPDDLFGDDFTPIAEPAHQEIAPQETQHQRPRNDRPNRGRGKATTTKSTHDIPPHTATNPENTDPTPTNTTTEPDQTPKPPIAVRGDRSATGGNIKPKLTEDELSARLEAAKLNSAKIEEAHRLAEADEASFQQREALASQKRKEEGTARRAMDQEREKNRLRKLGARGGREWDEGKQEEELSASRRSQYRRGAHGGTAYSGGRARGGYDEVDNESGVKGRGRVRGGGSYTRPGGNSDQNDGRITPRGSRGRVRGDRGRGRGDRNHRDSAPQKLPAVDAEKDFPALPASPNTRPDLVNENKQKDVLAIKGADIMQATKGESWADEMNTAKEPSGGW